LRTYNKEIELIDDYCEFLERQGCEYKREVRKGSYHSEGYIDILIKHQEKFVAVEAKLKGFQAVLSQASYNLVLCDYSYILYPRKPTQKNILKCKGIDNAWQIGIIYPHGKKDFLYLTRSISYYNTHRPKIERNWNENRIGRNINLAEIPEGYDMAKIEALKPDYKWVKRGVSFEGKPLKTPRKEVY
jgi:hypothetical protein